MTRILSITMAIIIMLTAGANTEMLTASAKSPTTISTSAKTKPSPQKNKKKPKKKKKKHKHVHYMPKGNMVRLRPLAVRDEGSNKNCRTVKICRRSKPKQILGTARCATIQ